MFIGYWLSFKQWFSNRTADTFSKLVLNLSLPASMFLNIIKNFTRDEFLSLFSGMIIPLLSIVITYGISKIWQRFFQVAPTHHGSFSTMFTFSNTILLDYRSTWLFLAKRLFLMSCFIILSTLVCFGRLGSMKSLETALVSKKQKSPFTL